MMFHVYILRYPNDQPFYVGKGRRDRARRHLNRSHSAFVRRIIAKIQANGLQPLSEITFSTSNEAEAHAEESRLIAFYGRRNNGTGILANLTDGGEGQSGRIVSVVTRQKIGARSRGRIFSDATRAKIAAAHRGRKHTAEVCAKYRRVAIERATPEYRIAQAERTKLQWTPERRAAFAEFQRRRWANDGAYRSRVSTSASAQAIAQWSDPEQRARLLASRVSTRKAA